MRASDVARTLVAVTLALAATLSAVAAQAPSTPPRDDDRAITALGGGLYEVRAGSRHTVFVVTTDGILLVDPLSVSVARWLEDEFAARFPDLAVRSIVLTHHHADRASGATVFIKTAEIVAHAGFSAALLESRQSDAEAFRFVPTPRSTFTQQRTIDLGSTRVELVSIGPFDSPDQTAVVFPAARLAFVAHPPPVATAPFQFGHLKARDVVSWLAAVSRLDADRILFSDGTSAARSELSIVSDYFSRMRAGVLSGFERGQSLTNLQRALPFTAYKDNPHYPGRLAHIEAMYRQVEMARIDIIVSGLASYLPQNAPRFCEGFNTCLSGGAVPFGSVAGLISVGRRIGIQGEFSGGQQFWGARSRSLYNEETVLRLSRATILFKANVTRSRSVAVLAGFSQFTGDVKGMDRVQGRFPPVGGRHPIGANDRRNGFTVGLELSPRIGPMRLVLPVRVSRVFDNVPEYWPDSTNASAGLGVSFPVFRRLK